MAVARGVGSPEPAPPLLYKWGGLRLGEPGCALERRGTAIRGGPKEQGRLSHPPSPNAFPEVRAQSQEPGLLGLQGAWLTYKRGVAGVLACVDCRRGGSKTKELWGPFRPPSPAPQRGFPKNLPFSREIGGKTQFPHSLSWAGRTPSRPPVTLKRDPRETSVPPSIAGPRASRPPLEGTSFWRPQDLRPEPH